MITSADLAKISLFADVEEKHRVRLARKAADVRIAPGEYLIREGEEPRFFVFLEGELTVVKNIVGQWKELGKNLAGEFSGEVPIFMGTPNIVSIRADTHCRVARFERQQLQELIRDSESAGEIIFQTMTTRFSLAQKLARETPSARVKILSSKYDTHARALRSFLSAHRIQFDWHPVMENSEVPFVVTIDGQTKLHNPTVRQFAEAFGFPTVPKRMDYDVVIAGAGPAGMAAAVYGASEGLSVLLVERFAAGGQAGTSSRIENYLGFPAGISGDELTERALKQAKHFGTHIVIKRNVEALEKTSRGYCVKLDGGDLIAARAIVLTTGISWHRLDFEGHDQFLSRGIVYGASRMESGFVAGKRVFIVGGGNSAGQAAMFFSSYAAEVIMLVRGKGLTLTMSQYLIDQLAARTNISVEPYTQVTAALGEDHLEQITTITRTPGEPEITRTRDAQGLFIMIGATAQTDWLPEPMERNPRGYICTGRDLTTWPLHQGPNAREPFALETSIPGIFCAGDVRHNSVKRVASSVGEGSMAISFIHEYLSLT